MRDHEIGRPVGRVVGLWRYPVKSMAAEPLTEIDVSWHGFAGDRRWAFVRDGVPQSGFPWLTLRERADLNHYRPSFVDPTQPDKSATVVHTPAGVAFDVADPALAAELYPQGAHVIKHDRGVFDTFPLSLITTQTIDRLGEMVGTQLDVKRFRPNIVVEAAGEAPFQEDDWVGSTLRIGAMTMRVDKRDGRCVVITIDPVTSERNPTILRTVARNARAVSASMVRRLHRDVWRWAMWWAYSEVAMANKVTYSRAALFLAAWACFAACAENLPTTATEIDTLARSVAGDGDSVTRTQRLVSWMNSRLEWVATDYQRRTPEQILARGAGNCADLSSVLERLIRPAGIPYRWVAEINLQPASDEREADAREMVKKNGPGMSVFGRRHNDHRWLEVLDERSKDCVPADPSTGLVGTRPWLLSRVALGDRPAAPVPAAAESLAEMIVPLAIFTAANGTTPRVDRSEHYLVDELDHLYAGRTHSLASWPAWVAAVRRFAPLARGAFEGRVDLHQQSAVIDELANLYERLQKEAHAAGLTSVH